MLVAFSVATSVSGDDGSVTDAVADAVRIVRESGLPNHTDAMFTTIEGDWDEVTRVAKECMDAMKNDCGRVYMVLKVDYRAGQDNRMKGKVETLGKLLDGE